MNKAIALAILLGLVSQAKGQDLSWLVEQAPLVTAALAKVLGATPSFGARLQLHVAGQADPVPTTASGTVEYDGGGLRWQAKLEDINSPQLTSHAKAAIRQINGDQLLLVTRPDLRANYLVLATARACLEQPLPELKLATARVHLGKESVDGRLCSKEKLALVRSDGATNEVLVWRAKDLQNAPVQFQINASGEILRIRMRDLRFQKLARDRFELPVGLAKYGSLEDLIQSVLIDSVKKRIGLE